MHGKKSTTINLNLKNAQSYKLNNYVIYLQNCVKLLSFMKVHI